MLLGGNRIEKCVCLKRINEIIKLDKSSCLEKSVNKGKGRETCLKKENADQREIFVEEGREQRRKELQCE